MFTLSYFTWLRFFFFSFDVKMCVCSVFYPTDAWANTLNIPSISFHFLFLPWRTRPVWRCHRPAPPLSWWRWRWRSGWPLTRLRKRRGGVSIFSESASAWSSSVETILWLSTRSVEMWWTQISEYRGQQMVFIVDANWNFAYPFISHKTLQRTMSASELAVNQQPLCTGAFLPPLNEVLYCF